MRAYWILPLVLIGGLASAGCYQKAPAVPHNSAEARKALVTALEAWKKGEAKSLAKRNPPIRFVDDDLLSGLRLSDYEIDEPDLELKLHQDVSVILELRDAKGKRVRREARYQVGTDPNLSVLRSDR